MNENSAKDATQPKKPRVKIVASRYAQALQKTNLEPKPTESNDRKLKRSFSSRDTPSKPIVSSKGIARSTSVNSNRPSSLTLQRQHPVQQEEDTRSVQDRLKEYRTKKELEKQQSTRKKPVARPANSTPASRLSTVSVAPPRPLTSGGVVPSIPQTPAQSAKLNTRTPMSARSFATPSHSSVERLKRVDMEPPSTHRAPPSLRSEQEEMELLQCMYYQLCLCEAQADDAFARQQKSAESQLLAAWEIAQSKMQLLHDTAIRLDREKHVQQLEGHLQDQRGSFANALIKLETFMSLGSQICEALQAALYRLPTPGLYCTPATLKNRLDDLSASLQAMLELLESHELGKMVKDMVSFEDSMRLNVEEVSTNLISLSSLTEDLQIQLDAETSMKIQQIQEKRLQTTGEAVVTNSRRWLENI